MPIVLLTLLLGTILRGRQRQRHATTLDISKTMPIILLIVLLFNAPTTIISYKGDSLAVDPSLKFDNHRLKNAYIALQAWKEAIISDPKGITGDWIGSNVCNYTGVFCYAAPDNERELTVATIDLNHAHMAGRLPHELGLLYDVVVFHLNTNRFCGTIPQSFVNMNLLYELDLSNNRFAGTFPQFVLQLPHLKYLDIRFNEFEGELPRGLFERDLDALFINNNRFSSALPDNLGNSPVSVIVLANNKFSGCIPRSLGNMGDELEELILLNNGFVSCFPSEIVKLKNLTVLDLSRNKIVDSIPDNISEMTNLEQLNLAYNMMTGKVPENVCQLPNLQSFDFGYNYFTEESQSCLKLPKFDDSLNCIRERPKQKTALECQRYLSNSIQCSSLKCQKPPPPPPSPPSPSPPRPERPPQGTCPCLRPPPPP